MIITNATFVMSNTDVDKCPKEQLPEYAFIGRSNVGKSSLINMLLNHKNLAKTSATPGKTQLINHFKVNENWFLVDLPGYGYAKVSKKKRATFQQFIESYFLKREQLVCAFVLVDARHEPQKIDIDFINFLGEHQLPFAIIFTKADKINQSTLQRNISVYKEKLLTFWEELPPLFVTSSSKELGRKELLAYIHQINESIFKS